MIGNDWQEPLLCAWLSCLWQRERERERGEDVTFGHRLDVKSRQMLRRQPELPALGIDWSLALCDRSDVEAALLIVHLPSQRGADQNKASIALSGTCHISLPNRSIVYDIKKGGEAWKQGTLPLCVSM